MKTYLFASGLLLTALQCLCIREYLAVFQGNELTLGLVLALWLAGVGWGSVLARRLRVVDEQSATALLMIFGSIAVSGIRLSPLLFSPGETIGPFGAAGILAATEFLPAVCGGMVFGAAARGGSSPGGSLYGLENGGGVAGSLIVYGCVVTFLPNAVAWAAALAVAAVLISTVYLRRGSRQRRGGFATSGLAIVLAIVVVAIDPLTVALKYPGTISLLRYGHEGEIAQRIDGSDTTIFMNRTVYASTLEKPVIEQAVHLPMAQIARCRRALVILDRGQSAELSKYAGLKVDRIETEPAFARKGTVVGSPQQLRPALKYDAVFLGAGVPVTAAGNRFFTAEFFSIVKTRLLADSGVFSFTLPLSENYLSSTERRLLTALTATLRSVFADVWVVPGDGYTFMASSAPLARSLDIRVPTTYLATHIIAGIDSERIRAANRYAKSDINTADRPIALSLSLQRWLELYRLSLWILGGLLAAGIAAALLVLPKTLPSLSMASSGLVVGVASTAYLILYQAICGGLYEQIAIFLITLTLGFSLGTLAPRLRAADAVIGIYAGASIVALVLIPAASPLLFLAANGGLGILAGAQFKGLRADPGAAYAADLAGGVVGMALSTTVLFPLMGAIATAIILTTLKIVVGLIVVAFPRQRP